MHDLSVLSFNHDNLKKREIQGKSAKKSCSSKVHAEFYVLCSSDKCKRKLHERLSKTKVGSNCLTIFSLQRSSNFLNWRALHRQIRYEGNLLAV